MNRKQIPVPVLVRHTANVDANVIPTDDSIQDKVRDVAFDHWTRQQYLQYIDEYFRHIFKQ